MAIYPTKTSKINNRSKKVRAGITLISIFSVLFVLLVFNFLQLFTKFMIGTFGLVIYPVCIFLITLGILLTLNKSIKTSKSVLILSIFWMIVFMLILQLATSKNIDTNFANYITTIFKSKATAGGVIFGVILYPLYYLTYSVAAYIILVIALVVLTAFLIDRIYVETKRSKANIKTTPIENTVIEDEDESLEDTEESSIEDDEEKPKVAEDEDIFIDDEEENEQREEAKSILGLSKDRVATEPTQEEENYTERLEKQIVDEEPKTNIIEKDKKPNIFVHDDEFGIVNNSKNQKIVEKKEEKVVDKDEERKKAALDYLNISKGKFETKNQKTGFDNVKTTNTTSAPTTNLNTQHEENKNRLSILTNKLDVLKNTDSDMPAGQNPFRNFETKSNNTTSSTADIYDENFTKSEFAQNKEKYVNSNNKFNSAVNDLPAMAKQVYSGETKENIVESNTFRPVQVSINEPVKRPNIQQKIYKKPPTYVRPPIDLLKKYATNIETDEAYIAEKGQLIVDTLKAFRIDTRIINAIKGPTFTRYELQMAPGISVNSVNNKINDLSMALESTCRVQVPIPGKNAFGIEVPNKSRMTVGLREILESSNFQNSKSPLTFALGKDISATCKVACIDKLVHTLVAGSTGSGKSVCLNTMLVSLLYKASPEDLRLILVDPKTVEFSMFNGLPHMLIPNTITECDKAVSALGWLVEEMDRRYKRLNQLGVKKISEYNETPEVLSGQVEKMYYIVMVFDEVGDFMNRAKKEIEDKILLLAAKSRACGIHLILATQRPTVDVITGTIKANLPSRIAFAVNSYNDSKTILESSGAEYLLGMGDMLFLPQGTNDMDRIQGCFIDNNELKAILNFVKENNEAIYDEEIEDQMFNKKDGFDSSNGAEDAFDPLLKDCLRYFIKSKKASASSLQAYFGIGYPKANKIVLQMEKAGFVSPGDNNGRRTLYITQQEFEERFGEDLDE